MATSSYYKSGLHEIQTQWSLDDLLDAQIVLDAFARAEKKAASK